MLEQFFKSQIATVSDPYQCNRITDALAAAGIKFYCKTKDVNSSSMAMQSMARVVYDVHKRSNGQAPLAYNMIECFYI